MSTKYFFIFFVSLCLNGSSQNKSFNLLCDEFIKGYEELSVAETDLDYTVNFSRIADSSRLRFQRIFFTSFQSKLNSFSFQTLSPEEKIRYRQLQYECDLNVERVALETDWIKNGKKIPSGGLYSLHNGKAWYAYYVKLFTSTALSPEKVHNYGLKEVQRIHSELDSVQQLLHFLNAEDFYQTLQHDSFYLKDKSSITMAYEYIDKTVRKNLHVLFRGLKIPAIGVMEWPNANAFTPPGIYLSSENNPYGKDVFQYNFFNARHNRNNTDWLFLHEAIPGHHMQYVVRRSVKSGALQNRFFYFGNSEGWACYIEDLGGKLGLYTNTYSYIGKLQWDLVRSARLVMETGIHYYGWTRQECMNYWRENIRGQDDIAEREITRITNWPGQSLCYKAGALYIKNIVARYDDIKTAHQYLLEHSDCPLEVL